MPQEIDGLRAAVRDRGAAAEKSWNELFAKYAQENPQLAAQFNDWMAGKMPEGWDGDFKEFEAGKPLATRRRRARSSICSPSI